VTALAPLLQAFFTDRLMTQYGASAHTVASYRDTWRLLLSHVHRQTGKLPAQLDLADLDAATIGGFLHDLETVRGNSIASRNTRLAAIHSLFRYASLHAPEHAQLISRVLAIQPNAPPPAHVAGGHHLLAQVVLRSDGVWHALVVGREGHAEVDAEQRLVDQQKRERLHR
jgi:integrase